MLRDVNAGCMPDSRDRNPSSKKHDMKRALARTQKGQKVCSGTMIDGVAVTSVVADPLARGTAVYNHCGFCQVHLYEACYTGREGDVPCSEQTEARRVPHTLKIGSDLTACAQ